MTVQTITTTGTTNWVAPPGVTTVQVELWGAGGTGGPATGTASGAGGGAGGQYAIKQVTVTPGTTYAVVVPAASTALTSVVNGADATFASTTVVAKGGAGGAAATGATSAGGAGSTTGGVGDTVFAGGSGGTGVSSTVSAGGGSGAGSTGTGNSGSGQTAGVAKANNGGAGGTGVSVANTRNAGSNYGGGGSGGLSSSATDRAGGNGAQGLAVLTYTLLKVGTLTDTFTSLTNFPNGTNASIVSNRLNVTAGGGVTGRAYAGSYDLTSSAFCAEWVQPATDSWMFCSVGGPLQSSYTGFNVGTSGTVLRFVESVAGVESVTTLTYDAVAHRWVRLRHDTAGGGNGTVYWDTSPDGIAWTNRRTKTAGQDYSIIVPGVEASGSFTQTEIIDNFNVTPPVGKAFVKLQAVNRASTY